MGNTNASISRRDFLKLGGLLPLSAAASGLPRTLYGPRAAPHGSQNVIIVVFDALSALNLSLYGYQRDTTPNLARLAERAVVYHNHFAGSNFTTSGTASLLTGTFPWTHRALQYGGKVATDFESRSVFNVLQNYYRTAYTHNGWAYTLLRQFGSDLEDLVPPTQLLLPSYDAFLKDLFRNDHDVATVSLARTDRLADGYSYSLYLSHLYRALEDSRMAHLRALFPRGLPGGIDDPFVLEHAIDWTSESLTVIPQPFFGYFHFLPPHDPYNTSAQFFGRFADDGFSTPRQPVDVFIDPRWTGNRRGFREAYDEFVLYIDQQFGRFLNALETSGLLENTWVIFTSDHGEMFDRGIIGHTTEALYQPLVRIPLVILEPKRTSRIDVQTPTSAVDVLPTLAQITGNTIPNWAEGTVLPPYAMAEPDPNRAIYAVRAVGTAHNASLTKASTMLVRGRYKLLYYFGYAEYGIDELVKLYDVQGDPNELVDLYPSGTQQAADMLRELRSKIQEVNQPYR